MTSINQTITSLLGNDAEKRNDCNDKDNYITNIKTG